MYINLFIYIIYTDYKLTICLLFYRFDNDVD